MGRAEDGRSRFAQAAAGAGLKTDEEEDEEFKSERVTDNDI